MIQVKYKFEDSPYKFKMFIEEKNIVGDIMQAEDPMRYIIWDCEIIDIQNNEVILKRICPNNMWYRMVQESRG